MKTVTYGTETLGYLGSKIWLLVPEEIKNVNVAILKITLTGEVGLFSELADVFLQNIYFLLYTSAFMCKNPVSKKSTSFGVFWLAFLMFLLLVWMNHSMFHSHITEQRSNMT